MKPAVFGLVCGAMAWAAMPTLPVGRAAESAGDPVAAVWKTTPAVSLSLRRTPLLYSTDPPAALEIPAVQIQLLKGATGVTVRLEWADKTRDEAKFGEYKRAWQGESLVTQSEATDRFSDACAVMIPVKANASEVSPSLQMGDAGHPVQIYFWDASRGSAVMEARGRETTKRTGKSFAAQAVWANGKWAVTLQLPDLPTGTPLAVAIWNGHQEDRDGRKYFSIWYKTQ